MRIEWNSRSDPGLARWDSASMSCQAEAAHTLPYPEYGAPPWVYQDVRVQRERYWHSCMRAAGYFAREVPE